MRHSIRRLYAACSVLRAMCLSILLCAALPAWAAPQDDVRYLANFLPLIKLTDSAREMFNKQLVKLYSRSLAELSVKIIDPEELKARIPRHLAEANTQHNNNTLIAHLATFPPQKLAELADLIRARPPGSLDAGQPFPPRDAFEKWARRPDETLHDAGLDQASAQFLVLYATNMELDGLRSDVEIPGWD